MKEIIRIALACDHAYAAYMETCIISILSNNCKREIEVNILDTGMTDDDVIKIRETIYEFGASCQIVPLRDIRERVGAVPLFLDSLGTYGRLFLPEIFPQYSKILYLDCDIICNGAIDQIWDINIDNYYVAGVIDTVSDSHKKELGMEQNRPYINAGVMLINLDLWREDKISSKIFEYIEDNKNKVALPDQDGINVVCGNDGIKILDARCNVMSPVFLMPYNNIRGYFKVGNYYTQKDIKKSKIAPILIHFTGYPDCRPWEKGCHHPLKKLFWIYASKSKIGVNMKEHKINKKVRINLMKLRYIPYHIFKLLRRGGQ